MLLINLSRHKLNNTHIDQLSALMAEIAMSERDPIRRQNLLRSWLQDDRLDLEDLSPEIDGLARLLRSILPHEEEVLKPDEGLLEIKNWQPFAKQVAAQVDSIKLTPERWQTESIIVIPSTYAAVATTQIADLHGRMGHFPTILRIPPVEDVLPQQYAVAELLDLQNVRNAAARPKRQGRKDNV